ncbi:MAG: hypothetical protein DPW18_13305 [Chloroflexi bacterium]|nr:hypothetical protein [Chloroflexota bacterium]MDL1943658.1 hypothetical protein [Chloroflexi bacterium CFX2]
MKFLQKYGTTLIILILLAAASWLRIGSYGDLRLSIANAETDSYISSSRASVFSWGIFAGQRLFTTNLLYKFANDSQNCPITSYGKPGIGQEDVREVQSCFDKIALLQNLLAVFGWSFLAWTTARRLNNPASKIAAAVVITAFGFTPQIAEWDSVLSPESLSLSMFAITLGMGLELAFRMVGSEQPFRSRGVQILFAGWIILFLLWVFVRDVHLYAIPVTLALLAPLFLLKKFRATRHLAIGFGILAMFFVVGYLSARDSFRATRYPVINALDAYIWPHPARVEYFRRFGMPERDAANYQEWADHNATKAYGMFLVSHPGFVVTTLWGNLDQLSGDFSQPYFFTPEVKNRELLLTIGQLVHPETAAVYLLTLLLAGAFTVHAVQRRTPALSAWAWMAAWFFGIAAVTLLLSFFGDTAGTRRHIMPSAEMFRLFLWVFLMPFLDLSLAKTNSLEA